MEDAAATIVGATCESPSSAASMVASSSSRAISSSSSRARRPRASALGWWCGGPIAPIVRLGLGGCWLRGRGSVQRAGGALVGSLAGSLSSGLAGWLAGWLSCRCGQPPPRVGGFGWPPRVPRWWLGLGALRAWPSSLISHLVSRSKGFFVGVLFLVFFSPMYWQGFSAIGPSGGLGLG